MDRMGARKHLLARHKKLEERYVDTYPKWTQGDFVALEILLRPNDAAPEQADADGARIEAGEIEPPPFYSDVAPEADSVAEAETDMFQHLRAKGSVGLHAENATLRADLATVTAERNEAFNVGTALESDLAAERKAHAETKGALISYNAALIEEQEHANGLAGELRVAAAQATRHAEFAINKIVAAHDARRKAGGVRE